VTDRRRIHLAGAFAAVLVLAAGCGDGGEDKQADPTPSPSSSETSSTTQTPSPSESETPSESPASSGGLACDAIDVAAIEAETGIRLTKPDSGGKPGKKERCASFYDDLSVLQVDLMPRGKTLEQDFKDVLVLGTEKPEERTVAGERALMTTLTKTNIRIGLVTHVGERTLQVVALNLAEDHEVAQLQDLVLAVAEQVAPAARGTS